MIGTFSWWIIFDASSGVCLYLEDILQGILQKEYSREKKTIFLEQHNSKQWEILLEIYKVKEFDWSLTEITDLSLKHMMKSYCVY
jgi:hypothetical protein